MNLIPVTIVTGFLGAGKTTLLQHILTQAHGQKIAVIENEFGEESIDNEILVADTSERIVQMNNGCICCTMREDLHEALLMLLDKRRSGELDFGRVVVETTGLADPGPVAQTFFMSEEVAQGYMLDSIVTLVDARHAQQQLSERQEARLQVGFADRILLSKADLVTPQELHALEHRLRHMNPRAAMRTVHMGEIDLDEVLDLCGFNLNAILDIDPQFLAETEAAHGCGCGCGHHHGEHGHDHHGHHGCGEVGHHHAVDDDVKSFVFRTQRRFDPRRLEDFMAAIANIYGPKLLRYKGVLNMRGTDRKVIFQGVHQLMGSDLGPSWEDGGERQSCMVFIGVDLPRDILRQGLEQCLI